MGGKGGHMLHPYEDPELTFQDLINMFEHTAMGGLEGTIKRDGQNLVLSYSLLRDEAVAIRNDDHVFAKGMGLKGEGPKENFADYLAARSLWVVLTTPDGQTEEFATERKWNKYLKENGTSPEELEAEGYSIDLVGHGWKSFRNGVSREKKATPQHIIKAFSKAMRDLENVAREMPQELVVKLFGEDADYFYNAEVMSPLSRNAIEYGVDTLSTHRILHHKYDEEGKELDTMGAVESGKRAEMFDQALRDYYQSKGVNDDPRNPPPVSVGAMERLAAMEDNSIKDQAIRDVKTYASSNGLNLNDTIGRLVFVRFRKAVNRALPHIGPEAEKLLVIRMFQEVYDGTGHAWGAEEVLEDFGDNTLQEAKVTLQAIALASTDREQKTLSKIKEMTSSAKRFHSKIITPLVNIIFRFSANALGTLQDMYVLNRDAEIERTRGSVLKTINNLETLLRPINSDDPKAQEKWEKFLSQRDKFKTLEDKISDAEGFVFQWPPGSDNTYKFTGLFAPINQLLGMDPSRWAESIEEGVKSWSIEKATNLLKKHVGSQFPSMANTLKLVEETGETMLYLPGGFKPPHKGHFALVRDALEKNPGAKLVIMSGEDPRGDITLDKARQVWDIYFDALLPGANIEVRALKPEFQRDSDGNKMQKFVMGAGKKYNKKWDTAPEAAKGVAVSQKVIDPETGEPMMVDYQTQSPINSIGNAVRFTDQPGKAKIVASSEDPGNAIAIAEYLRGLGLDVEPEIVPVRVKDKSGIGKMSARDMRQAIAGGFEAFVPFLPDELVKEFPGKAMEIFTKLGGNLEEISTGVGMVGSPGPIGYIDRSPETPGSERECKEQPCKDFLKEEEEIVTEVLDYLLSITVG